MVTEKDDIELLERAWLNQLSPEETERLNERLLLDSQLAALRNELFALWDGLAQAGEESETRALFKQWDEENPIAGIQANPSPMKPILKAPIAAVISAVVVIGAVCAYFFFPKPITDEQLFAKYFEGDLFGTDRTAREPAQALTAHLEDAYLLYAQKHYLECEKKLQDFLASDIGTPTEQEEARFYRGMALMQLGRYEESTSELDILSAGKGDYMRDATWYAALAYLRIGERAQAKSLLEKVCFMGGVQKEKAQELLKKL